MANPKPTKNPTRPRKTRSTAQRRETPKRLSASTAGLRPTARNSETMIKMITWRALASACTSMYATKTPSAP